MQARKSQMKVDSVRRNMMTFDDFVNAGDNSDEILEMAKMVKVEITEEHDVHHFPPFPSPAMKMRDAVISVKIEPFLEVDSGVVNKEVGISNENYCQRVDQQDVGNLTTFLPDFAVKVEPEPSSMNLYCYETIAEEEQDDYTAEEVINKPKKILIPSDNPIPIHQLSTTSTTVTQDIGENFYSEAFQDRFPKRKKVVCNPRASSGLTQQQRREDRGIVRLSSGNTDISQYIVESIPTIILGPVLECPLCYIPFTPTALKRHMNETHQQQHRHPVRHCKGYGDPLEASDAKHYCSTRLTEESATTEGERSRMPCENLKSCNNNNIWKPMLPRKRKQSMIYFRKDDKSLPNPKPVNCTICGRSFQLQENLLEHAQYPCVSVKVKNSHVVTFPCFPFKGRFF